MAATGVGGGLLSGIAGGGGGSIMIPLMTGVLKMRQHTAHGTSLVIITFAAFASAITYSLTESVNWLLVAILIGGSTIGAFAGARGSRYVPAMRLRQALGIFLLVIAARLLLFPHIDPVFASRGVTEVVAGAVIGVAGGLTSGALGVGGGAIFVPSLVLVLGLGHTRHRAFPSGSSSRRRPWARRRITARAPSMLRRLVSSCRQPCQPGLPVRSSLQP